MSVFMFPSDRVDHLYTQALGSLFIAWYDSQGYGGGILTCLHRGFGIIHRQVQGTMQHFHFQNRQFLLTNFESVDHEQ
jgi:hypothetical protein